MLGLGAVCGACIPVFDLPRLIMGRAALGIPMHATGTGDAARAWPWAHKGMLPNVSLSPDVSNAGTCRPEPEILQGSFQNRRSPDTRLVHLPGSQRFRCPFSAAHPPSASATRHFWPSETDMFGFWWFGVIKSENISGLRRL